MKNLRKIALPGLALAALTLAGCGSDGPSSKEVRAMIEADQQKSMSMLGQLAGSQLSNTVRDNLPTVKDVKVVSCEKIQERLSRCVIELEISLRGQTSRDTVTKTFAQGSDGSWSATR